MNPEFGNLEQPRRRFWCDEHQSFHNEAKCPASKCCWVCGDPLPHDLRHCLAARDGADKMEAGRQAPTDAEKRKQQPLVTGCLKYFPDALLAVANCSYVGNEQHNPGQPLRWDRSKSSDEIDALGRHLLEAGTIDSDGVRHSAKLAWRCLALLQKELEQARSTL